jgi:hypothetical protein
MVMDQQTYGQLKAILDQTVEGKRNNKAIEWFNENIGKVPDQEINEKMQIFIERIDPAVNKRWELILKQYKIRT